MALAQLDQRGLPVDGATVTIDTKPKRSARTERDGGFVFDRLIGKRYRLTARHGANVGGPVHHKLSTRSDPAILRLRLGATVEVQVSAADSGQPVSGAALQLRASEGCPKILRRPISPNSSGLAANRT